MGKWKAIFPITGALIVAFAASILIFKYLEAHTGPEQIKVTKVESEAVPIAVAAVDLAWGTKIVPEMIRTVPFTKESIPPGYFSDVSELEGRVLISPLKQNEAFMESKLAPTGVKTGGVSAVLAPGKRAIAVKGDKVIGISGFVKPGNRVDVLVTMEDPEKEQDVTKLVLENISVLATGTEIQENDQGKPAPVDVYTLEVTPDEGEKLALASARGKLQFALRNIMDNSEVLTEGATVLQTLASLRAAKPSKKAARKKTVRRIPPKVEVIKGSSSSIVEF